MPSPSKRRTPSSGSHKKTKTYWPPQPPRWTLRSYDVSIELGGIKVVMYNDTPDVLTLAYTYQKPLGKARTIAIPVSPRQHHQIYTLVNATLVDQQEAGNVTTHTFYIYPAEGHHILYMMAFDTRHFETKHSTSPIIAIEYNLVLGQLNYSPVIPSSGGQFHATVGDYLLINGIENTPPISPPTGTGFTIETAGGPSQEAGTQYSPFGPPYHPIGPYLSDVAVWKLNVTAPTQTITRPPGFVNRIYGTPGPSAFSHHYESWLSQFDPNTGLGIQKVVSWPYTTRNKDLSLFYLLGSNVSLNPPALWSFANGFFNFGATVPFDITTFGTILNFATAAFAAWVFYAPPLSFTVTNVTKGWRKLPQPDLP